MVNRSYLDGTGYHGVRGIKERVQMSTPAFFDIEKEKSFNAEFQFPRVTFCCEFESDIEILPTRLKRAQFGKLVARAFEHRTNDFFQN